MITLKNVPVNLRPSVYPGLAFEASKDWCPCNGNGHPVVCTEPGCDEPIAHEAAVYLWCLDHVPADVLRRSLKNNRPVTLDPLTASPKGL